jgi:hypothetical protein
MSTSIEVHGRQVYLENDTLRRLGNVMEHPEFRAFIDKFCNKNTGVEELMSMFMLIRTYQKIEECDKECTPYEKLAIVDQLFKNSETRQNICQLSRESIYQNSVRSTDTKKKITL